MVKYRFVCWRMMDHMEEKQAIPTEVTPDQPASATQAADYRYMDGPS